MKSAIVMAIILVSIVSTPGVDKITPAELVARHLAAIGSAEKRSSTRSRIVAGSSLMNLRTGGRGNAGGPALLASQAEKVLLKAEFDSASYPFEKFGFDGKKLHAKQYAPGVRSPLAEFFMSHNTPFSEGLLGGTLSAAWPLMNMELRNPKLQVSGTEKIDGRPAYKLKYVPRERTELKITIFIDVETFQHVRTEYERVIAAPMGEQPGQSASLREMRYRLVEDFRDFKTEDGLTLPHTYIIRFSVSQLNKPLELDWTFTLTKFTFDYPIEEKEFLADT